MKLFNQSTIPLSKSCKKLVDDARSVSGAAEYLDQLERTWALYEPFAPPDFKHQLLGDESKFYSLTWEMILGAVLLELNYELAPSPDNYRPDLCINAQGKRIWVECVLPTKGDPSKPNSVQERPCDGRAHDIDHDKSVLRCVQALGEKKKQHLKWIEDGVCSQYEAFIIALNSLNLHLEIHDTFLPDIGRALYDAGDILARLFIAGDEVGEGLKKPPAGKWSLCRPGIRPDIVICSDDRRVGRSRLAGQCESSGT